MAALLAIFHSDSIHTTKKQILKTDLHSLMNSLSTILYYQRIETRHRTVTIPRPILVLLYCGQEILRCCLQELKEEHKDMIIKKLLEMKKLNKNSKLFELLKTKPIIIGQECDQLKVQYIRDYDFNRAKFSNYHSCCKVKFHSKQHKDFKIFQTCSDNYRPQMPPSTSTLSLQKNQREQKLDRQLLGIYKQSYKRHDHSRTNQFKTLTGIYCSPKYRGKPISSFSPRQGVNKERDQFNNLNISLYSSSNRMMKQREIVLNVNYKDETPFYQQQLSQQSSHLSHSLNADTDEVLEAVKKRLGIRSISGFKKQHKNHKLKLKRRIFNSRINKQKEMPKQINILIKEDYKFQQSSRQRQREEMDKDITQQQEEQKKQSIREGHARIKIPSVQFSENEKDQSKGLPQYPKSVKKILNEQIERKKSQQNKLQQNKSHKKISQQKKDSPLKKDKKREIKKAPKKKQWTMFPPQNKVKQQQQLQKQKQRLKTSILCNNQNTSQTSYFVLNFQQPQQEKKQKHDQDISENQISDEEKIKHQKQLYAAWYQDPITPHIDIGSQNNIIHQVTQSQQLMISQKMVEESCQKVQIAEDESFSQTDQNLNKQINELQQHIRRMSITSNPHEVVHSVKKKSRFSQKRNDSSISFSSKHSKTSNEYSLPSAQVSKEEQMNSNNKKLQKLQIQKIEEQDQMLLSSYAPEGQNCEQKKMVRSKTQRSAMKKPKERNDKQSQLCSGKIETDQKRMHDFQEHQHQIGQQEEEKSATALKQSNYEKQEKMLAVFGGQQQRSVQLDDQQRKDEIVKRQEVLSIHYDKKARSIAPQYQFKIASQQKGLCSQIAINTVPMLTQEQIYIKQLIGQKQSQHVKQIKVTANQSIQFRIPPSNNCQTGRFNQEDHPLHEHQQIGTMMSFKKSHQFQYQHASIRKFILQLPSNADQGYTRADMGFGQPISVPKIDQLNFDTIGEFQMAIYVCYHLGVHYLTRLFQNNLIPFINGEIGVYGSQQGQWRLLFIQCSNFIDILRILVDKLILNSSLEQILSVLLNCPSKQLLTELGSKIPRLIRHLLLQRRRQQYFLTLCKKGEQKVYEVLAAQDVQAGREIVLQEQVIRLKGIVNKDFYMRWETFHQQFRHLLIAITAPNLYHDFMPTHGKERLPDENVFCFGVHIEGISMGVVTMREFPKQSVYLKQSKRQKRSLLMYKQVEKNKFVKIGRISTTGILFVLNSYEAGNYLFFIQNVKRDNFINIVFSCDSKFNIKNGLWLKTSKFGYQDLQLLFMPLMEKEENSKFRSDNLFSNSEKRRIFSSSRLQSQPQYRVHELPSKQSMFYTNSMLEQSPISRVSSSRVKFSGKELFEDDSWNSQNSVQRPSMHSRKEQEQSRRKIVVKRLKIN